MDEYYRILESLPPALRTPLAKLDAHYAPHIQEIRLRLGQPVQFTIRGRLCPAAKFLPGTGLPAALETDTLRDCFLQLCRRSVYAYEHILINELTCFDRLFKKWSQTADPLIGHICIQILSILSGLCCVWIL